MDEVRILVDLQRGGAGAMDLSGRGTHAEL